MAKHADQAADAAAAERDVEAVLEEVIDASLHTDRAHHDELGRTRNAIEENHIPEEAPPSPREQPAAPIDIGKVDE